MGGSEENIRPARGKIISMANIQEIEGSGMPAFLKNISVIQKC
jgi:hypothetical protein